jgi:energy-coupling factor transport system substrate-specific component
MLIVYAVVAAYLYGALLNLWSWPTLTSIATPGFTGPAGGLDYVPGAPVLANLRRFGLYTLLTSTASWDTGRAIGTAVALAVLGRPILDVLHRASRRARLS